MAPPELTPEWAAIGFRKWDTGVKDDNWWVIPETREGSARKGEWWIQFHHGGTAHLWHATSSHEKGADTMSGPIIPFTPEQVRAMMITFKLTGVFE